MYTDSKQNHNRDSDDKTYRLLDLKVEGKDSSPIYQINVRRGLILWNLNPNLLFIFVYDPVIISNVYVFVPDGKIHDTCAKQTEEKHIIVYDMFSE